MKPEKQTRKTLPKQIFALAKRGKFGAAMKLARGWKLSADPACQIVDQWQAVGALEENPKLEHGAPAGFSYGDLVKKAEWATCSEVRRAVLNGDAEFFIRIAKRLKQTEPVMDDIRMAVLAGQGRFTEDGKPIQKTDKEIAFDVKSEKNPDTILREVRRFRRQIEARDK